MAINKKYSCYYIFLLNNLIKLHRLLFNVFLILMKKYIKEIRALLYGQRKVSLIEIIFLVTFLIRIKEIVCCSTKILF